MNALDGFIQVTPLDERGKYKVTVDVESDSVQALSKRTVAIDGKEYSTTPVTIESGDALREMLLPLGIKIDTQYTGGLANMRCESHFPITGALLSELERLGLLQFQRKVKAHT